jgi:ABC-type sugar transport system permease subunit/ABC-type glycerol-3-phosphate transport system substrate-binding protein
MSRVARALRLLLSIGCAMVVIWSFGTVGARVLKNWRDAHTRPVTLTIMHWGDPAENGIVAKLVASYEKANPNVRVLDIPAGDPGAFRNKIKTMMAAGAAPDLFYLPPDSLPELASLGLLKPIDELIARDDAAGAKTLDDFFPVLLDAFRYDVKNQRFGFGGALYGLPKDFTTTVFYANVDLCRRAGVDLARIQREGWSWDEFEDACRKIRALSDDPEFKKDGRLVYGGVFELWGDTIRQIIWSYSGDFFATRADGSVNFKDVTLDEPAAQEALAMIRRMRIEERTAFNATGIARDGAQEFVNGNIGFDGPVGRWKVPRYTNDMKFVFDVVPTPAKTKKMRASQVFTVAWGISAKSRQQDEAYKLMKFLCGPEGAAQESRLGLAIPALKSVAYSNDFLDPPGLPKHNAQVFLDQIAVSRVQQIPREAEWDRILSDNITNAIQLKEQTTLEAAKMIEARWLGELNSPLRQREWPAMPWGVVYLVAGTAVLLAIVGFVWSARREQLGVLDRAQQRAGYLFIAPWLIGFLALTAGPMLISLLLSFTKWSAMTSIDDATFVGTANYRQLVTVDKSFWDSLKVTGYFIVLAVPTSQVAALGVALLMNLRLRGITVFRTVYFVPSVVGLVAMSMLALQVFNNDYGILNKSLAPIARLFGTTPPDWFGADARRWAIPGFVIIGLWGVGGGMIIYLAGLKGIPASLYEAATIDGAGPARRLWNVTLPQLSPLIFYNLVMGIIGSFQVFTQAYIMTGAGPGNATLFYVLQLYRQAFEFHNMGYASATAWILFVIILVATLAVFRASKNLVYYEGLK